MLELVKTIVLGLIVIADTIHLRRDLCKTWAKWRSEGWRSQIIQLLRFLIAGAPATYYAIEFAHCIGIAS